MTSHNCLPVTTLDSLPNWSRLHQVAVGVVRGGSYWFDTTARSERLAVRQVGIRGRGRVATAAGKCVLEPGEVLSMRPRGDRLGYGLRPGDPPWHLA